MKRSWSRRALGLALAVPLGAGCSQSITGTSSLLDPEWPRSASSVVHISASGVSPDLLHLDLPVIVTFTNDDRVPHRLEAAPELGYGACAEMEQLGVLQPGESGGVTIDRADLICAFRDSAGPTNRSFQGFIVVH